MGEEEKKNVDFDGQLQARSGRSPHHQAHLPQEHHDDDEKENVVDVERSDASAE